MYILLQEVHLHGKINLLSRETKSTVTKKLLRSPEMETGW